MILVKSHYKEHVIYSDHLRCYYHSVDEPTPGSLRVKPVFAAEEETQAPDRLTESIVDKLSNPSTSSDFDFHEGMNQVLADVGMSAADSGGQLTFYGQDPIVPSRIRFATMAGIGLTPGISRTINGARIMLRIAKSVSKTICRCADRPRVDHCSDNFTA